MYRMTVCNRIALFLLASVVAFGETRTKGMIKSRTGETLIVSTAEGNVTVVLTDNTRTKDDKGCLAWTSRNCPSCADTGLRWMSLACPMTKAGL